MRLRVLQGFRQSKGSALLRASAVWLCVGSALGLGACSKKEPPQTEAAPGSAAAGVEQAAAAKAVGPKQESSGRAHLPEGCDLVTTIDWQRFRELKAVKPDLEKEVASLPTSTEEDAKKAAEFLKKADIDLLKDPGEIAICLWQLERFEQNETPGFVAVVGGKFRPGAAIEALDTVTERFKSLLRRAANAAANRPSDEPEVLEIGGVKTLRDKESGVLIAQAKDGAFVLGNDQARFEKALTAGKAHESYKLSSEPVGIALTQSASGFVGNALAATPFAAAASSFVGAHLGFDDRLLRMEAHFSDPKHVALVKQGLDGLLASAPPGTAEGAKIRAADGAVSLEVPLPEEVVNGMLQQLPQAAPSRPAMAPVPGAPRPGAAPAPAKP